MLLVPTRKGKTSVVWQFKIAGDTRDRHPLVLCVRQICFDSVVRDAVFLSCNLPVFCLRLKLSRLCVRIRIASSPSCKHPIEKSMHFLHDPNVKNFESCFSNIDSSKDNILHHPSGLAYLHKGYDLETQPILWWKGMHSVWLRGETEVHTPPERDQSQTHSLLQISIFNFASNQANHPLAKLDHNRRVERGKAEKDRWNETLLQKRWNDCRALFRN